jgi:hypothetical protein
VPSKTIPVLSLKRGRHIAISPHDVHMDDGYVHHVDRTEADVEVDGVFPAHGLAVVCYGSVDGPGPFGAICYDSDATVHLAAGAA